MTLPGPFSPVPGGPPRSFRTVWVAGALAALVFGAFLWSVRGIWSPVVLLAVLLAALAPFRRERWVPWITVTASVLTLFWIVAATGFLMAPFLVALAIAYILDPLVDWLSRWMPRNVAILLLAVPTLGLVVLLAMFGIPALWRELGDLIGRLPAVVERAAGWIEELPERLRLLDLPGVEEAALADRLRDLDADAIMTFLNERREVIGGQIWTGILGLGRGVATFLTIAGYVVLTPVLTFYLLRDWDRLVARLIDLIPRDHQARVVQFGQDLDGLIAGYLRGQVTVAAIIGSITALGLWALGFPYAFLLGALAAVFGVIPYLGLVLSLIPAIAIAFLTPDPGVGLLKVAAVYAGANILESAVISPRIVGDSTGLHPVIVVLALAVGGFFYGFLGLLLGVPAAAGLKLLASRGVDRYRRSDLYRGTPAARAPVGLEP